MRWKPALVLTLAIVLATPLVATDDDPAAVLALAKEATGGAAWDEVRSLRLDMTIATGGLEGTAVTLEDLLTGRYVDRFELGPARGAEGFDGEVAWSQDSSGQPRAKQGGDELLGAFNEAYRRSLAYWFPDRRSGAMKLLEDRQEEGRRFRVVRVIPEGGRPFDIWVDASSGRIDRTVEQAAVETRTTFFSDYREVEGVKIPFASRQTNGETQYDLHLAVAEATLDPEIGDDLFRMPPPPPPDFAFTAGRTSTALPFELLNGHIYLQVKLNGRGPFLVMCDTGGANIVTPTLAAELGLEPQGTLQGRGTGEGSEDVGLVEIESLTLGDVTVRDQLFAVFPLESYAAEIEDVPFVGLVGYEIFKRFVVRVDYQQGMLTLTLPEAFSYEGGGTVVPFRFSGNMPEVDGSLDGIPAVFTLDTGSRGSLDLHRPFVEEHGLVERLQPKVEVVTGWGVGGPVRSRVARAGILRLGEVTVERPVTELTLQEKGAFTSPYLAGNVGSAVLSRFDLVFDYGRQRVIFEPGERLSEPDLFDRSGMWINRAGDAFEVMDVAPGGPAERAGLEPGVRILAVDGRPAGELELPALRARLRADPPGTAVRLLVATAEGERELTLVLEDLV